MDSRSGKTNREDDRQETYPCPVTRAVLSDVPDIMKMMEEATPAVLRTGYTLPLSQEVNWRHFRQYLEASIQQTEQFICLFHDDAIISGHVMPCYYNRCCIALHEIFWFCRRPGNEALLLEKFIEFAQDRGCTHVELNTFSASKKVMSMLDGMGFDARDQSWTKALV